MNVPPTVGGGIRGRRPSEQHPRFAAVVKPGTRILIVDDEVDLLDMLTTYFLGSNYEVDTATNGTEALKAIMKMDQSIAVIMVTGNLDLAVTVEAIRNGAFGYVPKPFDLRYLDHLIAAGLGQSQRLR